jgi:hypothetical protein
MINVIMVRVGRVVSANYYNIFSKNLLRKKSIKYIPDLSTHRDHQRTYSKKIFLGVSV